MNAGPAGCRTMWRGQHSGSTVTGSFSWRSVALDMYVPQAGAQCPLEAFARLLSECPLGLQSRTVIPRRDPPRPLRVRGCDAARLGILCACDGAVR
eukprot:8671317-Pyramimonas_sp.AAC.1